MNERFCRRLLIFGLVFLVAGLFVSVERVFGQSTGQGSPLRFPPSYLSCTQRLHPLVDPRNGKPSDEYTRYVMASQQAWIVRPTCLNQHAAIPGAPAQPNSDQNLNVDKFYDNYSMKAGGSYEWYHPTYVTDLTSDLCAPVAYFCPAGAVTNIVATALSQMPPPVSNNEEDGELSELPGTPLTDNQCSALLTFENAHHNQAEKALAGTATAADGAAVDAGLANWVETAGENCPAGNLGCVEAERQLFDLIFTGQVDPSVPQAEFEKQTVKIDLDFNQWVGGFNCGTGKAPNVGQVQLHADSHNLRHACRFVNHVFSTNHPVYFRHYLTTYVYHTVTCSQLADD